MNSNLQAALNEIKTVAAHALGIPAALLRIPLHLLRALNDGLTLLFVKCRILDPVITITVVGKSGEK